MSDGVGGDPLSNILSGSKGVVPETGESVGGQSQSSSLRNALQELSSPDLGGTFVPFQQPQTWAQYQRLHLSSPVTTSSVVTQVPQVVRPQSPVPLSASIGEMLQIEGGRIDEHFTQFSKQLHVQNQAIVDIARKCEELCMEQTAAIKQNEGADRLELFFDADCDSVPHDSFKIGLMDSFRLIGVQQAVLGKLEVQIRPGSIVAEIYGLKSHLQEVQLKPLEDISVMGYRAYRSRSELERARALQDYKSDWETVRAQIELQTRALQTEQQKLAQHEGSLRTSIESSVKENAASVEACKSVRDATQALLELERQRHEDPDSQVNQLFEKLQRDLAAERDERRSEHELVEKLQRDLAAEREERRSEHATVLRQLHCVEGGQRWTEAEAGIAQEADTRQASVTRLEKRVMDIQGILDQEVEDRGRQMAQLDKRMKTGLQSALSKIEQEVSDQKNMAGELLQDLRESVLAHVEKEVRALQKGATELRSGLDAQEGKLLAELSASVGAVNERLGSADQRAGLMDQRLNKLDLQLSAALAAVEEEGAQRSHDSQDQQKALAAVEADQHKALSEMRVAIGEEYSSWQQIATEHKQLWKTAAHLNKELSQQQAVNEARLEVMTVQMTDSLRQERDVTNSLLSELSEDSQNFRAVTTRQQESTGSALKELEKRYEVTAGLLDSTTRKLFDGLEATDVRLQSAEAVSRTTATGLQATELALRAHEVEFEKRTEASEIGLQSAEQALRAHEALSEKQHSESVAIFAVERQIRVSEQERLSTDVLSEAQAFVDRERLDRSSENDRIAQEWAERELRTERQLCDVVQDAVDLVKKEFCATLANTIAEEVKSRQDEILKVWQALNTHTHNLCTNAVPAEDETSDQEAEQGRLQSPPMLIQKMGPRVRLHNGSPPMPMSPGRPGYPASIRSAQQPSLQGVMPTIASTGGSRDVSNQGSPIAQVITMGSMRPEGPPSSRSTMTPQMPPSVVQPGWVQPVFPILADNAVPMSAAASVILADSSMGTEVTQMPLSSRAPSMQVLPPARH